MAKIKKGILGPLSGKLGPVIGGMWKTIAYIRIAPSKKAKKQAYCWPNSYAGKNEVYQQLSSSFSCVHYGGHEE
jgi:hypothetical protein